MDHVAIMKKSWGLAEKILTGEKKIESRWYKFKRAPWDKIKIGDKIYFKNSSEPVTLKSEVKKIIQLAGLTTTRVMEILDKYGKADGIAKEKIPNYYNLFKDKKYCLLIFLKNPRPIAPFQINKSGFGAMAAWITVKDISRIKKHADRTQVK